ncbi:hypothetical protein KVT40_003656 [Elsinoe batatas]|uniref:Uncharacterized protein n=1 Tax=Elsinoe batatas TaxID=2601811 RepID=A0A8K0L412_9PEZI|nr:hypothetical protein KVT40_003656 [Elsinoe batatas]
MCGGQPVYCQCGRLLPKAFEACPGFGMNPLCPEPKKVSDLEDSMTHPGCERAFCRGQGGDALEEEDFDDSGDDLVIDRPVGRVSTTVLLRLGPTTVINGLLECGPRPPAGKQTKQHQTSPAVGQKGVDLTSKIVRLVERRRGELEVPVRVPRLTLGGWSGLWSEESIRLGLSRVGIRLGRDLEFIVPYIALWDRNHELLFETP